jgi:hypothetical protein
MSHRVGTWLTVFTLLAASATLRIPPSAQTFTRRTVARLACGSVLAAQSAPAYDSLPLSSGPDPAELAQRRKEREAKAAVKNKEVAPLLLKVRAATTALEFDDAVTQLTLWIIGTGPPIPSDGAAWGSTFAGPLPDGFRTRELVATCKAALDDLPRYKQEAGLYVEGLGPCEATRERNFCLSAGPRAESAYKSLLIELKRRAPRQYDTPYGPVAF